MLRLVIAVGLTSCVAGLSGTSMTPQSPSPSPSTSPSGGIQIRDVAHMTRSDAEELLRHDGFTNIVATGDTDPAYARDEIVCEQRPAAGTKIAAAATLTIRYCNTYKAPKTLPPVAGLSIDAAKQRVKSAGFTGPIEVTELGEFDKNCKATTVCSASFDYSESADQDVVTLYVNRKVTISAPD